ncbi:uncharacterized protein LOC126905198 isoform X1 [Daktulosphaira vitifoliae]|uniref:uncharacterized protein LOC126905198 isoform X1 n=1 Tax=Daktulosphaira vitifoliae TaxID=58002 RepID=UPI0021AAAA8D|nr:uncharacterized protein LOC126905198 isoform X1 [Daktulosphaira vitifoliae]
MISNFFLFSFLTLSCFYSVISREIYLDCYYSKYLLYNLNTKVIYFNKIVSVNKQNHILIENFATGLQLLGPIVVAFLCKIYQEHFDKQNKIMKTNQLWSINAFKNSQGLLSINFYLNNLSNTLLLQTYQNVTTETIELSDHEIFIDEFKKIYPNLIAQLKQNVLDACYKGKKLNFPDIVIQNQFVDRNYFSNVIINDLLPNKETIKTIFMEKNIEETMYQVQNTEAELKMHLKKYIELDKFDITSYHPNVMLFSRLFHESKRYQLSGMIEVQVNEKLENGEYPNMAVLFDMIKHTFDVDCVESFQRQVVAATIYPYYVCIAKFAQLLKKIIFGVYVNKSEIISRLNFYKERLNLTSENLNNIIFQLSNKGSIFPNSVQNHLKVTYDFLRGIINIVKSQEISKLNLGHLDQLYWRCANAMELNLIYFNTKVENIDMYDSNECDKIISQLDTEINDLKNILNSIDHESKNYFYFVKVLQVFSFDNTFSKKLKCNIVQKNKEGYHLMRK